MPRANTFKAALAKSEAQLTKAESDLQKAHQRVSVLTSKIPELRRACESLRVLCGQKAVPMDVRVLHNSVDYAVEQPAVSDMEDIAAHARKKLPPEVAAKMPVEDLTGIGSIPAAGGDQTLDPTNLPEDEDFYLSGGRS